MSCHKVPTESDSEFLQLYRVLLEEMGEKGPTSVEIKSCVIGGHLLGRGKAVERSIKERYPNVNVEHRMACPLSFSIVADGQQVIGGLAGTCTIFKLLTCCETPSHVAEAIDPSEKI